MNPKLPRILWALLPAAALVLMPAYAKDEAGSRELEQARKELESAREELKRAAQELRRVAREQGFESPRAMAFQFMADENRAMLGVIMGRGPRKDGKLLGVRVDAVTPGGGADKAGLKVGDVITGLNGKSIAQTKDDDETPGRKLREMLDDLKVGDRIKVSYEREGKNSEATVVASRMEPFNVPIPPLPPMPPLMSFEDDEEHDILLPGMPRMRFGMGERAPWQLVALDEHLAPYFKTQDGVLVTKAEPDNPYGLRSGDVIQKLDGETVKTPRDVFRQLRQVDAGDELRLDIVRSGKSETLKGRKPERERRERVRHIESDADEHP